MCKANMEGWVLPSSTTSYTHVYMCTCTALSWGWGLCIAVEVGEHCMFSLWMPIPKLLAPTCLLALQETKIPIC